MDLPEFPVEKKTILAIAHKPLRHFRGCPNAPDDVPDVVRNPEQVPIVVCFECGAVTDAEGT